MSIRSVTASHPEKTVAALSPFLSGQEITVCKCTGQLQALIHVAGHGNRPSSSSCGPLLPDLQSRAQKLTPMHVLQI